MEGGVGCGWGRGSEKRGRSERTRKDLEPLRRVKVIWCCQGVFQLVRSTLTAKVSRIYISLSLNSGLGNDFRKIGPLPQPK